MKKRIEDEGRLPLLEKVSYSMPQVLVRVQSVEPGEGYTATIRFTDGSSRKVNLAPYLRGSNSEPIRNDPTLFPRDGIE